MGACRGKNLFFSTDVKGAIEEADIIFASVNTPTKIKGVGAGRAADLRYIESVGRTVAQYANRPKIIIEKSTVPVKTAEALQRVVSANQGSQKFWILSNPEFLAEGTAMKDLSAPDRVLIGGPTSTDGVLAANVLVDIYANWVPREKILTTNLWSSEFLGASVGFGGSCFQKDILNLVYICESEGLHEVAKYWQMVVDMNEHQKTAFTSKIISSLFNTVTNKKIAVLGFAFKKDTGDVRETPAVTVCNMLLQDGASVHVYDPKVKKEDAMTEFKYHNMEVDENKSVFRNSPLEAVDGAHALVVLTEWDEFKVYPYEEFYAKMMKPVCVFDGRGILNHKALEDIGFEVHAIGKGRGADGRLNVLAQAQ